MQARKNKKTEKIYYIIHTDKNFKQIEQTIEDQIKIFVNYYNKNESPKSLEAYKSRQAAIKQLDEWGSRSSDHNPLIFATNSLAPGQSLKISDIARVYIGWENFIFNDLGISPIDFLFKYCKTTEESWRVRRELSPGLDSKILAELQHREKILKQGFANPAYVKVTGLDEELFGRREANKNNSKNSAIRSELKKNKF